MQQTREQLIKASFWGFVIGDCLGVPYEFTQPKIGKVKMVGYKSHKQKPGTWSDDTALMLATMNCNFRNEKKLKNALLQSIDTGKYYPDNIAFDVGGATASNLRDLGIAEHLPQEGNGSMMRSLPFAFLNMNDTNRRNLVWNSSYLTHKSINAAITANLYAEMVRLHLSDPQITIIAAIEYLNSIANDIFPTGSNMLRFEDKISNRGYCKHSLQIVIEVVKHATSFADGMKRAINFGGDTDTHAAMAGAILALKYPDYKQFIKSVRKGQIVENSINKYIKNEITKRAV